MPDNDKVIEQLQREIENLRRELTDLHLKEIQSKQAEEELWESERRFLRLLDGLPLAVFVLDAEGKPYYQNKASRELFGKDIGPEAEGRLQEAFQAYLAGTDQVYPTERSPIHRALAGDSSTVDDMEIRRPDRTIQVEVYGSTIYNVQGGIKYAVGVFHDISERLRAEEALRRSEAFTRAVITHSPVGITVRNREGSLVLYNEAWKKIWTLTDEKVQENERLSAGWPFEKRYPHLKAYAPNAERLFREGGELFIPEVVTGSTIPGAAQWVSLHFYALKTSEGLVEQLVTLTEDITVRKRIQEALAQSEALNRAVIQHSPIGITVRSRTQDLLIYNEAWKKIWAMSDLEVEEDERRNTGLPFDDRFPLSRPWNQEVRRVFEAGGEFFIPEVETRHPNPAASRWISLRYYALQDGAGEVQQVVTLTEDITGRKQVEESLRQSEERYRSLVDNLNVGVYRDTPGPTGKFIEVNPALVKMFGYFSKEELLEINVSDLYEHPQDRSRINEKLLRDGFVHNEVERLQKKDGTPLWTSVSSVAVRNERGEVVYYDGILEDITHRKQAEEALRESEERYRAVMEQTAEGIVLYDMETKAVLAVNPAYCKLLGYTQEEMLRLLIYDIVAADPKAIDHTFQRIREQKRAVIAKRQHRAKDGTLIDVEVRANLIAFGAKEALCVVVRDISERKQTEIALSESEERYRTLVENVNIGVYRNTGGPQGQFVQVNPAMVKMFGFGSAEELMARPVAECYQNPEEREQFIAKIKRLGFARNEELRLRKKDGSPFRASITAQAQFDAQGEVLWTDGVIEDITERKRAEEETAKRSAQFKALREIGLELSAKLDLETLLKAIAQRAMDLLGGISCGFYLYRPEQDLLEWRVSVGSLGLPKGHILHRGEGVSGKILESRSPLTVSNYALWEGRAKSLEKFSVGAVMGIPVQWGEEFLGVLNIASERPGGLLAEHQEMMLLFAAQAAIAIRNARIVEILQQSERDYHQLFEQAHDGVIVFEPKGEIVLEVNRRACELYGLTREEFLGMSLERISKDVDQGKRHIRSTFEKGQHYHFETVQYRKDGSEMLLEIIASVVTYKDRTAILSINRDITERKQAEEALQAQYATHRGVIESIDALIFSVDRNYRYTSFNRNHAAMMKAIYGVDIEIGRSLLDYMSIEADRAKAKANIDRALQGEPLVEESYSGDDALSQRYFEVSHNPIRNPGGEVIGIAVLARDLTERKRAEQALLESEARYKHLFENAQVGIYRTTPEGRVLIANPALIRMLGYASFEELASLNLETEGYGPEYTRSRFKDLIEREGEVKGLEAAWVRRDKTAIFVRENARVIRGADGKALYYEGTVEDISEKKQAEEALQRAHRDLEERVRERTTELQTATQTLETRNQQLSRILDTGGSMLVSLNLDTLLNEIAKAVRDTLEFDIVVLNVVDEVSREARFAAQAGMGEEARKALEGATVRVKWEDLKGLFQERFRVSRSCYFIPHGTVDWRTYAPATGPIAPEAVVGKDLDREPWHPEDALLALVELREKTVAGMFSLDSPRTGKRPSQETLLLLDVFANLAAVAIDNSRLYEQVQKELGERKQAQEALRQAHGELEQRVDERTGELRDTLGKLRRTTETSIEAMAMIVEMKDPYTAGHQRNVANLATALAQELNFDAERTEGLRIAAMIHDVGKIAIPTEILTRPGPLSELEHRLIRDHPQLSSDILKTIDFPWPVAEIVLQHHEKMDGSGYPRGLKGDAILMEARILVVSDVLESLAFHRPYRPGHGIEKALEELTCHRGTLYDGAVVDACLRLFKEKGFTFP